MKFFKYISHVISALAIGMSCAADDIYPPLDVTLNDFPPETQVGYYIQKVSSNETLTVIKLTNGVLTVGSQSINIAQPSHEVVITNGSIVVTNTYYAIYEDNLNAALKSVTNDFNSAISNVTIELDNYATKEKIASIVTNGTEIVTNWTEVAYMSDIPPDAKKADKVMESWDFWCPNVSGLLTKHLTTNAIYTAWKWVGEFGVYTSLLLTYEDGHWKLSTNNGPPVTKSGSLTDDSFTIDGFTFNVTNKTSVFVVYSDDLDKLVEPYVAKTNLLEISKEITDERLKTLGGIAEILRGIKSAVGDITGLPGIRLTLNNPRNRKVRIEAQGMTMPGDTVIIDWGDGTAAEKDVNLPAEHQYGNIEADTVTITITGFISELRGRDSSTPMVYFYEGDEKIYPLASISIDSGVGVVAIGDYAFAKCSGLQSQDLSFIPRAVTSLGRFSFVDSNISSLNWMPVGVTIIPEGCFENTQITTLEGMSSSVYSFEKNAFAKCSLLNSIVGVPFRLTNIGEGCFFLTPVSSIYPLNSTLVDTIGDSAFSGCSLSTIEGLPNTITNIGAYSFSSNSNLTAANFIGTELTSIGDYVFDSCTSLASIQLPQTANVLTGNSLRISGNDATTVSVLFENDSLYTVTNIANFAFGLPNDGYPSGKTSIRCIDGNLLSDGNGGWDIALMASEFSLTGIQGNSDVELNIGQTTRSIKTRSVPVYSIDWGDGTINNSNTHTYELGDITTNITVRVMAELDSISGTSESPFITVNHSQTNDYLTSVKIGGAVGLRTIGVGAFRNCRNLSDENIEGLNAAVTSLGDSCFENCAKIKSSSFLESTSVTELPNRCFRNSGMEVVLFQNVESIGSECFKGCIGITNSPVFSRGLISIGDEAFSGCSSLPDIDFIESSRASIIPTGCFMECAALSYIRLGSSQISAISNYAFYGCSKISVYDLPGNLTIGYKAFESNGSDPSVAERTDEDGFKFKLMMNCRDMTYSETAAKFGLQDGEISDTYSGINPQISKFICSDGDLLYNNGASIRRWEVVMPALEIELREVPAGTSFKVEGTRAYDNASLVWNWGDGHIDKWITSSPANHTYTNTIPKNYIVKVKGLLKSISSPSSDIGAYIHPSNGNENPYLVGFKMAEGSPIQAIGNNAFSRCPNLHNINTKNLPEIRGIKRELRRNATTNRLDKLSAESKQAKLTYGEGCFLMSGISDMSGLPSETFTITNRLFAYNTGLEDLSGLPSNVIDINDEAFRASTTLRSLSGFPSSVGYISSYCFAECIELPSLYGLNQAPITMIGDGAFASCESLNSLYGMPDTTKTIGIGAFQGTGLYTLSDMPNSVTNIKDSAFAYCNNLISTDGISSNITFLSRMTFLGCTNLRDVVSLPQELTTVGDYCFIQNPNLTNVVFGANIKNISLTALAGCGADVPETSDEDGNPISCTISFPFHSVSEIRELWGTNFTKTLSSTKLVGWNGYIIFQDGEWVDRINTVTFRIRVGANTEVNLGYIDLDLDSPLQIRWGDESSRVSDFSSGLNHLYMRAGEYDLTLVGKVKGISSTNAPNPFLYSPNSTIEVISLNVGNNTGMWYLGDSCFRRYSTITNLSFMAGTRIELIGEYCFEGCNNLKSIDGIPTSVSEISSNAFANCTSLISLSPLTNSCLTTIWPYAFRNCSSITNLIGLGLFVTNIPYGCFSECKSLVSLDGISSSVTNIDDKAFASCESLSNIFALSNTVVYKIGAGAFSGCKNLHNIKGFPPTIIELGNDCFMGCTSLIDLEGDYGGIESLPSGCFRDCTGITTISNVPPLLTIGESCFSNCISLVDCTGFSVTQDVLSARVFSGCKNLNSITFIPSVIESLGENCFSWCTGIKDTSVNVSVTNISDYALAYIGTTNLIIQQKIISLSPYALYKIGYFNNLFRDEFGNDIKSIVRFNEFETDEIIQMNNFPFGADTNTTRFVGKDGYVYNGEAFLDSMEFDISVSAGDKIRVGTIIPEENHTVSVSWGDGSGTNNITLGDISHQYSSTGNFTIKVSGRVREISAIGDTGAFITKMYGATPSDENNEVNEFRVPSCSSLKIIGTGTFRKCKSLKNVILQSTQIETIGDYAFSDCDKIKSIQFGSNNIISFGKYAFSNTGFFKNITWMPSSLVSIGDYCFKGCSTLRTIGAQLNSYENLESIGVGVFSGCGLLGTNWTSQTWPERISVIPTNAFYNCSSLSVLYTQPTCSGIRANALYNIGRYAPLKSDERGVSYRAYVYITHKTCEEVMSSSFSGTATSSFPFGATKQTKFVCANGYISHNGSSWEIHSSDILIVLENVSANEQVTIRHTETKNGLTWYFGDGTSLSNVKTYPITHTYSNASSYTITAYGEVDKISGNSSTSPWVSLSRYGKVKSITFNEACKIQNIGNYCLSGLSDIESIIINSRVVTNIGQRAFYNCRNLKNIKMPKNNWHVHSVLGNYAFGNCVSLKEIDFLDGLFWYTQIGTGAFSGCSNMTYISMRIDKATIGNNAFSGIGMAAQAKTNEYGFSHKTEINCDITSSYAPDNNKTLAEEILTKSNFSNWNMPSSTIFTSADGFVGYNQNWRAYEYAVISYYDNGKKIVHYIDNNILTRWDLYYYAQSIKIGNEVIINEIADDAFKNMPNLTNITRSGSIRLMPTKIGNAAFFGCSKLVSVPNFGTKVQTIGESAFSGCKNLPIHIITPFPVCTKFGREAFRECYAMESISWMSDSSIIGEKCFYRSGVINLQGYPSAGNKVVPTRCFMQCPKLRTLDGLPSTITKIDDYAFADCTNLTSISALPQSVITIGKVIVGSFYDMEETDRTIRGENKVISAAMGKVRISNVSLYLPNLQYVGYGAFGGILPNICDDVTILLDNAKLKRWETTSFSGGMKMVISSMTTDELWNSLYKCGWINPLADVFASDGIIANKSESWAGTYYVYTKISGASMPLCIMMRDIPAQTEFSSSGFGNRGYSWGDGATGVGSGNHIYYSGYNTAYPFFCRGPLPDITSSGGPIVKIKNTANNPCVSHVFVSQVSSIGGTAFSGFTKCEEVRFATMPTYIGNSVLNNLGINLSYKTIPGISLKYKSMVYMEMTDCSVLLGMVKSGSLFGAPTSTVFSMQDGYVYHNGSAWTAYRLEASMTIKWDEVLQYTVSAKEYWKKEFLPATSGPGATWMDVATKISKSEYDRLVQEHPPHIYVYQSNTGKAYKKEFQRQVLFGPIKFYGNGHGFVSVDNGPKIRMQSDCVIDIGNRNKNTDGYVSHTIKVYGKISEIRGFVSQDNPNNELLPVKVTSLDLSKCVYLQHIGTWGNVDVSPASANIPNSVKTFSIGCFANRKDITTLTWLPTSLTAIPDNCFAGCKNLDNLYGVGNCTQLKSIGWYAFRDCTSLSGTLAQQKSNNGCFCASVTDIGIDPFQNVGYGNANKVFAVCMKGKSISTIVDNENIFMSADQANVGLNGSIGRLKWYGTDGYIEDVNSGNVSTWRIVRQNTGL